MPCAPMHLRRRAPHLLVVAAPGLRRRSSEAMVWRLFLTRWWTSRMVTSSADQFALAAPRLGEVLDEDEDAGGERHGAVAEGVPGDLYLRGQGSGRAEQGRDAAAAARQLGGVHAGDPHLHAGVAHDAHRIRRRVGDDAAPTDAKHAVSGAAQRREGLARATLRSGRRAASQQLVGDSMKAFSMRLVVLRPARQGAEDDPTGSGERWGTPLWCSCRRRARSRARP